MIYTKHNLEYCMANPLEWFIQWRDDLGAKGYRTISLTVTGSTSAPIYSAVMVKPERPFRGQSVLKLTKDELADKIEELAAGDEPLYPYIVAATGSGSNVVYAAAFREMAVKPFVKLNMFPNRYREEHATQRAAGRMLLWVDAFGTPDDIRYCAVWGDNPDDVTWNADGIDETGEDRQERFEAMTSIGARPALVAMTPRGGVARLYVNSRLKHSWNSKTNMSGTEFSGALDAEAEAGRFPVRIGTAVVNNEVRYSAIFAKSDEVVRRQFRIRGPEPIGLDAVNRARAADIDAYMESYVRAHNFRGAALAIVEGTRLVYAKGYTFAEPEPHYRDIEPTTLFRMGSVSKTFCALAVWKALADGEESRGSRMQDILQLKQGNGSAPAAPKFTHVKLRHLLESNSGINQGLLRDEVYRVAANANGPTQPLGLDYFKELIAESDMDGDPGAKTVYGRVDYFLLSLVAMQLAGVNSFDAALKKLLFDPLHIRRTRSARSRIEDRGDDEALHHATNLGTGVSAVHADRRIVPITYGFDNFEVYLGAGGLSSAVIDVARLGAMLNCRVGNPLFSSAILEDLLTDAVEATKNGTDHGYHGFDRAVDKGTYIELSKGGGLDGLGAGLWGRTGQRFIAIARNGSKVEGATPVDWNLDINAIAAMVDWGSGDLFPQFGMPSIGLRQTRPDGGFTPADVA